MVLLQKTMKNGSGSEANILLRLLTTQKAISLTTIVTSFHVFPRDDDQGRKRSLDSLVLPLSFEAVIDFKSIGKMITVPLKAPGTISGRFDSSDGLLTQVEIALDTIELLDCMMNQARLVVRKTLQVAAKLTSELSHKNSQMKRNPLSGQSDGNSVKQILSSSLRSRLSSEELLPKKNVTWDKVKDTSRKDTVEESKTSQIPDEDESSKPLFHEFFSWLQNDDMVLKEEPKAFDSSSSGDENDQPMPTPLSSLGWQAFTDLAAARAEANENQEQAIH